jgi:hypothetical protein
MVLDEVDVQVRQAIHAFPGFFRRLANGVDASRIEPRAIECAVRLFVAQRETFPFVGRG